MAGSFLSAAGKKTTDIRGFLRVASSEGNSIKYKAEAGKKHFIYIPYALVPDVDEAGNEVVSKQLVAIRGLVHDWYEGDKYKTVVCLKDVIRNTEDGTVVNDGSCPFCKRETDAWEIYNYRLEMEKATCGKTGDALIKHIENIKGKLADERKAKGAKDFIYILIVKFRMDAANKAIIGSDGLPEYDLKVVKWSTSRAEKIQQQIENSGDQFAGSEMIFEYPNLDDVRQVVGQSTTSPVFPTSRLTQIYPDLINKINADVNKFEWEGIDKAYPEWSGMSTAEAEKTVNDLFKAWDDYQLELKVNPNARYLEYVGVTGNAQMGNPALGGAATPNVAPQIGQTPGVTPQMTPQMTPQFNPQAGIQIPGSAPIPGVAPMGNEQANTTVPDANAVFGGSELDI